jgi:hypothetical protein
MVQQRPTRLAALVLAVATLAAGCGGPTSEDPPEVAVTTAVPPGCADVIDVVAMPEGSGAYRFEVTVRSADTGWDKFADLWEVRAPDGTVLGERVLAHPHVEEQPFTRSQSGIEIPAETKSVTVVARDSVAGFCGQAFEVEVP